MTEKTMVSGALLGLHALTALHPGCGTALGTVDLPVQRERHTQWPVIAGSALKGVLRDACREIVADLPDLDERPRFDDRSDKRAERSGSRRARADATLEIAEVFGPPTAAAAEFAGAVSVTDARLLAYPVRSLKGVFAWVTCPAALERLQRDAQLAGVEYIGGIPSVASGMALIAAKSPCLEGHQLLLEEFDYTRDEEDPHPIADWIAAHLLPQTEVYSGTRARFLSHFAVLSDDDFTHYVRHATEIAARIALNYETKTVREGALFYQEFLPAESLFYAVVLASPARARQGNKNAGALLEFIRTKLPSRLQVGGDETTGRGMCAVQFALKEA